MNKFFKTINYITMSISFVIFALSLLPAGIISPVILYGVFLINLTVLLLNITCVMGFFLYTKFFKDHSKMNSFNEEGQEGVDNLYPKLIASNKEPIKGKQVNYNCSDILSTVSDCLTNTLSNAHTSAFGLFSNQEQLKDNESIRRREAIKDYNEFKESKTMDLNFILELLKQKLNETDNIVRYINLSLPEIKNTSTSKTIVAETHESASYLFSQLATMMINYPQSEKFSKMSAKEIETYNGDLIGHHKEVIDMATVLLSKLSYDVTYLHKRFEDLSKKMSLTKSSPTLF